MKKFLPALVSSVLVVGACDTATPELVDPVSFTFTDAPDAAHNKWGVLKIRDGLAEDDLTLAKGEGTISASTTFILKDKAERSRNWHIPGDYYLTAEIYDGETRTAIYVYVADKADDITDWDDVDEVPKFAITQSKAYSVDAGQFKNVTELVD